MLDLITLQSIKYQVNDPYKREMISLITEMYDEIDAGLYTNNKDLLTDYGVKLDKVIKKRFNLNIVTSVILSPISYMGIIPFSSDILNKSDNNLVPNLSNDFSEKEVNEINSAISKIIKDNRKMALAINDTTGEIDFKRAYVRGYPSKVRHHLMVDIFMVKNFFGLTPEEVAATITHEVGHAFTGLAEHYNMVTTNQPIQKCLDYLNKNDLDSARYVFKSIFGEADLIKAKLDKSKNRMDFYGAVANKYIERLDSQYQQSGYDATSFEYLSDAFATNMGFGDSIATALRKIQVKYTGNLYTTKYMSEMLFTSNVILMVAALSTGTPLGIFGAAFLTAFNLSISWMKANHKDIYDNFQDRNSRIKREMTNAIKTGGIPKEEIPYLINQWEIVDALITKSTNFEPFTVKVMRTFVPSLRKEADMKKQQILTEEFLNNDLFVKTAKLKLLGDKVK